MSFDYLLPSIEVLIPVVVFSALLGSSQLVVIAIHLARLVSVLKEIKEKLK